MVLVKKKDQTWRLCIEFRALNKVTVLDAYPLPSIETHFSKMSGCRYFTSLDILSAFWQVPMKASDIAKTAFCTPFGNFEWLRMPFGLVNATATFQRLMDETLAHCQAFTFQYVDDIIIYDQDFGEHLTHLREVLTALRGAGLRVKFSKTIFAASSLPALGRVVSEAGVSPDPDNVRTIVDLPCPSDLTSLKSFLGMVGFYRAHMESFSDIAAPLLALTKSKVPLHGILMVTLHLRLLSHLS